MLKFMDMVREGARQVLTNPQTCECCGVKETLDNIVLKYDNGKKHVCRLR